MIESWFYIGGNAGCQIQDIKLLVTVDGVERDPDTGVITIRPAKIDGPTEVTVEAKSMGGATATKTVQISKDGDAYVVPECVYTGSSY